MKKKTYDDEIHQNCDTILIKADGLTNFTGDVTVENGYRLFFSVKNNIENPTRGSDDGRQNK